jgi:hypothetical protein
MPARLAHDSPAGHDASEQQVSSTQLPEAQSAGLLQPPPFGIDVLVAVAVTVGVAVGVSVGVWLGVNVGVCVGWVSQKPAPVLSMQMFWPTSHASATPPEQSASVLKRSMLPEQVLAQRVAHSMAVEAAPEPQHPADEQLPHGVHPHEHTQHAACATRTDVRLTVAMPPMHTATKSARVKKPFKRANALRPHSVLRPTHTSGNTPCRRTDEPTSTKRRADGNRGASMPGASLLSGHAFVLTPDVPTYDQHRRYHG